jgi:DNA-directed RNA polymerase beta' subunit
MLYKKPEQRFKEIKNLTKNTNYCYNCGTPVGTIKKEEKESTASIRLILEREIGTQSVDDKTGEVTDTVKKTTKILTPRDCQNILKNLSDVDCFILGFNPKIENYQQNFYSKCYCGRVITSTFELDDDKNITFNFEISKKIFKPGKY